MFLQLADNGLSAKHKTIKRNAPKFIEVAGYKRSSNVSAHKRRYPILQEETNPYIFIPDFENGGGIYIREDKFDSMPTEQFKLFIQKLAPLQPDVQKGVLSEMEELSGRAERKARRDEKKDLKLEKKENKEERKTDKNERKNKRRDSKDEARQSREERKAEKGGFDWDKAKDVAGNLIGKFTGKGGAEDTGGADTGGGGGAEPTPFYKNPIFIVGGLLLIGGGIYLATRPKKAI